MPANAINVTAELTGADAGQVDLFVAHPAIESFDPVIGAAPPRAAAVVSAVGNASPKRIDLNGANLRSGRWYLTPANRGPGIASVRLKVSAAFAGTPAPIRDNLFVNPTRTNSGWFLNRAGDVMALAWYTYDDANQPVWYFAVGPGGGQAVWRQPLLRYTRGVSADQGRAVGEVIATRVAQNRVHIAWRLDGRWGAEPLAEIANPSCQTINGITADFTGNWYQPVPRGLGLNTFTMNGVEAYVPYLYDSAGNPRWVIALANLPNNGVIPLSQFIGPCPDCAFFPGSGVVIGTFTRSFTSQRTGQGRYQLTLAAPLVGSATTDAPIARLTDDLACGR